MKKIKVLIILLFYLGNPILADVLHVDVLAYFHYENEYNKKYKKHNNARLEWFPEDIKNKCERSEEAKFYCQAIQNLYEENRFEEKDFPQFRNEIRTFQEELMELKKERDGYVYYGTITLHIISYMEKLIESEYPIPPFLQDPDLRRQEYTHQAHILTEKLSMAYYKHLEKKKKEKPSWYEWATGAFTRRAFASADERSTLQIIEEKNN